MEPKMNLDAGNIKALIEAQARGELIQTVPVENNVLPEPELDARVSKLTVQPTGFPPVSPEAQPTGFGD